MPYIYERRADELHGANRADPQDLPELTFVICDVIDRYVAAEFGATRMEEALGALDGARLEFARRIVGPYEERKRHETTSDPFGLSESELDA